MMQSQAYEIELGLVGSEMCIRDSDTEGPVTFSLFFSDSAGNQGSNVTETSDGSTVAVAYTHLRAHET